MLKIYPMLKILSNDIDFTDDYHMLSLVSHLKDYSLCFHVNKSLNTDFEKYEDFILEASDNEDVFGFSWYYFHDESINTSFYLIGNKSNGHRLLPSQKQIDFFLLVKEAIDEESIKEIAIKLRKTTGINAVIKTDISKIKNINILLEAVELHELEFVKKEGT